MKYIIAGLLVASSLTRVFAGGPPSIRISSELTKEGSRSGGHIGQVKNVKRTEEDYHFTFSLTSESPSMPAKAHADWVVLVETLRGDLRTAAQGRTPVELVQGKPFAFDTSRFTLVEKTGPKGRSFDGDVYGYGIRVVDASGAVLAEQVKPEKSRRRVMEALGPVRAP